MNGLMWGPFFFAVGLMTGMFFGPFIIMAMVNKRMRKNDHS